MILRVFKKGLNLLFRDPRLFLTKIKKKAVFALTNPLMHFIFDPLEIWLNPYPKNIAQLNSVKGYSIVMITGADDLTMLETSLKSIDMELAGSAAEIVLVGPSRIRLGKTYHLPLKVLTYRDLRFMSPLITHKKNLGASICQYDKIIFCHDYISFEAGWKQGWDNFGNDFEVAINRIENKDGSRWRDWLALDYPNIGAGFLPYTVEVTPYMYISGTYFMVKKDFYLANPLNNKLRWGEAEDIEWSKRIRKKTVFKLNPDSCVTCLKQKDSMSVWKENTLALMKIFNKVDDINN